MLKGWKQLLHYLVQEPFSWIFYCYFQPSFFKREIEPIGVTKRVVPILRMMLPMFVCVFPISALVRETLCSSFAGLYITCSSNIGSITELAVFFRTAVGCMEGLLVGIAGGMSVDLAFGISVGLAVGLTSGVGSDLETRTLLYATQVSILFGLAMGVSFGLTLGLLSSNDSRTRGNSLTSIVIGSCLGSVGGLAGGLTFGFLGGILVSPSANRWFGTMAGATLGGAVPLLLSIIVKNILRSRSVHYASAIRASQTIGITFGVLVGASAGTISAVAFTTGRLAQGIGVNVTLSQNLIITATLGFLLSYIPSYYRLPLYPVSAFSTWKAFLAIRKDPHQVFHYLQRSALYWDERVFLSLPGLQKILLLAASVDAERTRDTIEFIITERPEQTKEACDAATEIAIQQLELSENFRSIIAFSSWFDEMFLQGAKLIKGPWVLPFEQLKNASRHAARYYSPVGWQARERELQEMMASLKKIHPNVAFEQHVFNKRLSKVIEKWLAITHREQERIKTVIDDFGSIPNPYISGQAIKLGDTMFVGRLDLVQYLERVLSCRDYRPTFFLTGERRMGKSSTLNQLHHLLSERYLTIVHDLQFRGKSSSASIFLWSIADAAINKLEHQGIRIKRLEYNALKEAERENEAAVYYRFDSWFAELERSLAQVDRVLLLAFDEFEKLEEASQGQYLDLRLLLDWFRFTIQHYFHVAFLFSGVKHLGDMGEKWSGYFVNVETLRVSFLRPAEAHRLITKPYPGYPSKQIFGEGVVEEIMHMTGCHPFLVQAVCSKLIDRLNMDNHAWAEVGDVAVAVNQVLEGWWSTYFQDLWERTSQEQRICLFVLKEREKATLQDIVEKSDLDLKIARKTLDVLCQRDLVLHENENYAIAAPILYEWVERNG